MDSLTDTETSRRVVLGSAAALGAGAVLSACAGNGEPTPEVTEAAPAGGDARAGASLGPAADVPVGSGVIVASAKAVVTQPTEGQFKAFSYICTHKGCPVSKLSGDTITCTCHGSQYSTDDGSVKKGPATEGLAELSVSEKGGELFLG